MADVEAWSWRGSRRYVETSRTTLEVDGRPVDLGLAPTVTREETNVRTVDRDAAIEADLRAATVR
ncbi:MAG: hypothetical protein R3B82_03770 [Sandaracinaceae bacterium]